MKPKRIPLSEVLEYITLELRQAHGNAVDHGEPVMKFQECELEFAIEFESKAEGGFKIFALQLGGGVKRTDSNTIKIKYTALGNWVAETKAAKGSRQKPKRQGKKVE